jgi:hypothetical protein
MNKVRKVVKVKVEEYKDVYPRYENRYGEQLEKGDFEAVFDDDNIDADVIKSSTGKNGFIKLEGNTLLNCCGVIELGNLKATNVDNVHINHILNNILSVSGGRTVIINTNGKQDNVLYEKALAVNKNFTLVKTFVNPSSKNTIKMWVSNN